jgi:hypothetical protein
VERTLPLRIVVLRPPPGTVFRLQRGRVGVGTGPTLVAPTHESPDELVFDFTVRVGADAQRDGSPLLVGAFAHGSLRDRFIYVTSGRPAVDGAPWNWDRRAKVPLGGITADMIEAVLAHPDAMLEARIEGTARDGRAAAATVPILDGGWEPVRGG